MSRLIQRPYCMALAVILVGIAVSTGHATAAGRPNIVFVLADDLGWTELGCYGNTFNETPGGHRTPWVPRRRHIIEEDRTERAVGEIELLEGGYFIGRKGWLDLLHLIGDVEIDGPPWSEREGHGWVLSGFQTSSLSGLWSLAIERYGHRWPGRAISVGVERMSM